MHRRVREPAEPESLSPIIGMKCGVSGPHTHPDPAGAVVTPGPEPGPIQQPGAEALVGEGATHNQAAHVHSWIPPSLGRPDGVYCAVSGDRRGRFAVLPGDPGVACDQILADPV